MRINVPVIKQIGPRDCGLACVAMILKYYGRGKDSATLAKNIKIQNKLWTYMPQLGKYLIDNGFKVDIITMNPYLFNAPFKKKSQADLLEYLKEFHHSTKEKSFKAPSKFFIEFMEAGGRLTVRIPTVEDIKKEIASGRPLLALLTDRFLASYITGFNFHCHVVTGIDDKLIHANDPAQDRFGGKKKYPINDYMYGLYASAHGDLDNASIMKIRKIK